MWRMGAFSSFSLTNIARSPWTPVKVESLGVHLSISVENIDFTFVAESNFKVSTFYAYVLLEETVGFFLK